MGQAKNATHFLLAQLLVCCPAAAREGDVSLHLKPTGDANPFEELFGLLAHPSGADRRLAPRRTTVPDQIENSWRRDIFSVLPSGGRPNTNSWSFGRFVKT